MNKDFTITVITGATCSGKTEISVNLAKKTNSQIICADSRSIYKGFDIVSAKIKKEQMQGIKHYLLDIISPDEDFSAGDFVNYADIAVKEIVKEGKNVIITGGTWFYIKSFLDEKELPKVGINKELRSQLNQKSSDEIWQILNELDPIRAQQVHKNNTDKVIRSIEMCKGLNMPISQYQREQKQNTYRAKWYMPKISRGELYERINKRVDMMIEEGLYEEWQKNKTLHPNSKVMRTTIGYREFFELEEGVYKNFSEAVEKIKQRTRNFAKRQLTYFRSNRDIEEI